MTAGERPRADDRRAAGLAAALRDRGLPLEVSVHEGIALLRPAPGAGEADLTGRAELVALARSFGFTHVALEVALESSPGA